MGFTPQDIINSRIGVGLALGLGRFTPPGIGYGLANFFADRISSRRNWPLVHAVRTNQWMVSGKMLRTSELDRVVRDTFRHHARCLYDLYHYVEDPSGLAGRICFNQVTEWMIERSRKQQEGTVIVGVHLSNFDFVMQMAGLRGLRALTLSAPQPGGGYQWQNDLRRRHGLEIIPASMNALRQATARLCAGGMVLTGIDRPQPNSKYRPKFFGAPAALPVHHIYLALKSKVPVVVVAAFSHPDGSYELMASDLIYMQPHVDHTQELIQNAERVLKIAENFIRQIPQQWAMFYPVWPEFQAETP